jgi:predicted metal-dependent hydrolase
MNPTRKRQTFALGYLLSLRGTVTLAIDLLAETERFQDFVIIHELLHHRFANHGRMFKALMSVHVPWWRDFEQPSAPLKSSL